MDGVFAALLGTPPRGRRLRQFESNESAVKEPAPAKRGVGEVALDTQPEAKKPRTSEAVAVVEAPEASSAEALAATDGVLLEKLFDGLESVLVLLASRKARPALPMVRDNVENLAGRDLTEDRLKLLLGAAGDMLDVVWIGRGAWAVLEIVQRAKDGEARVPTSAERVERSAAFKAAVADKLPAPRELPPQPMYAQIAQAVAPAAAPPVPEASLKVTEAVTAGGPTSVGSGSDRMKEMKARILRREASDRAAEAHRARITELARQVGICEDAMAAHGVVLQLFARGGSWTEASNASEVEGLFKRGQGQNAVASEAEVVAALTASRRGMQHRRPLDPDSAREAIQCLTRHAAGWFRVEAALYSLRTSGFLRRNPGGSSTDAMAALTTETKRLQEERTALEAQSAPAAEPEQPAPALGSATGAVGGGNSSVDGSGSRSGVRATGDAGTPIEIEDDDGLEAASQPSEPSEPSTLARGRSRRAPSPDTFVAAKLPTTRRSAAMAAAEAATVAPAPVPKAVEASQPSEPSTPARGRRRAPSPDSVPAKRPATRRSAAAASGAEAAAAPAPAPKAAVAPAAAPAVPARRRLRCKSADTH